jgi:hypothetical protein
MRKIVVTVGNDGESTVEAVGHRGGSCVLATQPLRKSLIGTPSSATIKPEYYQGDNKAAVRETE